MQQQFYNSARLTSPLLKNNLIPTSQVELQSEHAVPFMQYSEPFMGLSHP